MHLLLWAYQCAGIIYSLEVYLEANCQKFLSNEMDNLLSQQVFNILELWAQMMKWTKDGKPKY